MPGFSWSWIAVMLTAPLVTGLLVAYPLWRLNETIFGNLVGSAVIFAAAFALIAREKDSSPPITFSRDIAPIIFARCGSCHRPDGDAPFSLLTYDTARQRAAQIADVTRRRFMPPWKSEPGYGEFAGQRHLTAAEI